LVLKINVATGTVSFDDGVAHHLKCIKMQTSEVATLSRGPSFEWRLAGYDDEDAPEAQ